MNRGHFSFLLFFYKGGDPKFIGGQSTVWGGSRGLHSLLSYPVQQKYTVGENEDSHLGYPGGQGN